MFGFILPNLNSLGEEEKTRYQAVYCGVCRSIRARYGQRCRLTVSYDLTFMTMVLGSMYEPIERTSLKRCPVHPAKPQAIAQSEFSDYAADLSVAMAYHKLMDDWLDDRSAKARAAAAAIAAPYKKAKSRQPAACQAIEQAMADIHEIEKQGLALYSGEAAAAEALEAFDPDAAANRFGMLMGQLFAWKDDFWATDLRRFGARLGKFVYAMDAAMDLRQDRIAGSYNPFILMGRESDTLREDLQLLAAETAEAFERLPLERDVHILRSVLYSGVWQRFNAKENKEHGEGPL